MTRKVSGTGGSGFVVPTRLSSDLSSGVVGPPIAQIEGPPSDLVIDAGSGICALPGWFGMGRVLLIETW